MAKELNITPEWFSKITNEHRKISDNILLRAGDLARRNSIELSSSEVAVLNKKPVNYRESGSRDSSSLHEESPSSGSVVASRIPPEARSPSTRADVEHYMKILIEAAENSGNPNAWPVIYDRLKKRFPLDEWEEDIQ